MNDFVKQIKTPKTIALVSLVAVLLAVLFWVFYLPSSHRFELAALPPLPDLSGQPQALVDYLQQMNNEALRSPSSAEAIGNLALAYQSNFFYDEAKQCEEKAMALAPQEWRWIYYSALIDEELGDTKATIEKLRRVVGMRPVLPFAWLRLGNSYLKTNSYSDAENAFKQVLTLKDYVPETTPEIALSDKGAFPLKAYASFNLARTEFLQNKLDEAKNRLLDLVKNNPKFGPAYRLLGNVCQKLGDASNGAEFETRAGDFESYLPPADPMYDAMILSSRNTAFLIKQFDIAAKSENYDWTMTLMNRLVAINPDDGEILMKRMKLALDQQKFRTVDSLLPTFYRACGSDEKKLIDMARYFVYRSQYEPAVALLKRAITVNQKAMDAHTLFVDILMEFKQYGMGINYCKEILSLDPRNAELRNKLARMYIEQGNLGEARQQLKIADQLSPNTELKFVMLARISRKERSVNSAAEYYEKALTENPNDVNTQLEAGNYLVDLRKWPDALNHLQKSLRTSPNDLDLLERYAWLLSVCPIDSLTNGERALELANRLALRRKYTKDQEMRCGITLAAAYARVGQFDRALEVANKYLGWSRTLRDTSYLRRLEAMVRLFKNKAAYRL